MKRFTAIISLFLLITFTISAQDIFRIIAEKDSAALEAAISAGADINARDDSGNTPLFSASLCGANDIVKLLLLSGADVQVRNIEGRTALHWAAKSAPLETLLILLNAGTDIDPADKYGITPAIIAAQSNLDPRVSDFFIKAGAYEPDDTSELLSISMKSAAYNFNADVLRLYLPLVENINAFDILGQTMLMEAARFNPNEEVVSVLLEEGADINLSDCNGMTALLYAAKYNHNPAVIETLLHKGAEVAIRNNDGESALDYASENEYINRSSAFWALNDGMYSGF
jgi:ankyrin repeat protein